MVDSYPARIERADDQTEIGPAALTRRRGAPLLLALAQRLPDAVERSEIAVALGSALAAELAGPLEGELIAETARLQEIGKLYVPVELVDQVPEALAPPERRRLEVHFEGGQALARGAGLPERACSWILHARECWDGSGPGGLTATEIPLGSRIIAVTREYLDAPLAPGGAGLEPRIAAIARLEAFSGSILDPSVASLAARLATDS